MTGGFALRDGPYRIWGIPPGTNSGLVALLSEMSNMCYPDLRLATFLNSISNSPALTQRVFNLTLWFVCLEIPRYLVPTLILEYH